MNVLVLNRDIFFLFFFLLKNYNFMYRDKKYSNFHIAQSTFRHRKNTSFDVFLLGFLGQNQSGSFL